MTEFKPPLESVIKLPSGTEVYANGRIIGIGPDLSLYYGYDGNISDLSKEDLIDLADLAIQRWDQLLQKLRA